MENKNFVSPSSNQLNKKLQENYGVKQAQIYSRLKKLTIKPHKENGEVWLDDDQIQLLDELHAHISNGGTMDEYKTGEMVVATEQAIEQTQEESIEQSSQTVNVNKSQNVGEQEKFNALVKSAQSKAAGIIIAEEMLAAKFKENPELLPEELQEQVKAAREMNAPKSVDPNEYANSLIDQYMAMI